MLRQLLVGGAVSVCNIAIHGLVMATVVEVSSRIIANAKHTVRQSVQLTIVMIAAASITSVPVLMVAHFSEVMVWSLAYMIVEAAPAGADPIYFAFGRQRRRRRSLSRRNRGFCGQRRAHERRRSSKGTQWRHHGP